jgi:hypothetical protein
MLPPKVHEQFVYRGVIVWSLVCLSYSAGVPWVTACCGFKDRRILTDADILRYKARHLSSQKRGFGVNRPDVAA